MKPITPQYLYNRLKTVKMGNRCCQFNLKKCQEIVPLINWINELKEKQNAVILAHTYITPEIIYGVADFVGDSYGLSKDACTTSAQKIVFAAVRFMGETAKILNPEKEVLLPAKDGGCTLADAIDGKTVRKLRKQFPDHTFVCYINTTVDVKAECDVCVTSGNVYKIVERIPNKKIYFLPDKYMAENLRVEMARRKVKKQIESFDGACDVHEQIEAEEIDRIRETYPDVHVAAHPECKPEVCAKADFVGSTSQMLDYIKNSPHKNFLLLTECGLGHRIRIEFPQKNIVGMCRICDFMKSNSLEDIIRVLTKPKAADIITVDPRKAKKALRCIKAMFDYAN